MAKPMRLFVPVGYRCNLDCNQQARLLVQDCAEKLERLGLRGAIQEVSMIKARVVLQAREGNC